VSLSVSALTGRTIRILTEQGRRADDNRTDILSALDAFSRDLNLQVRCQMLAQVNEYTSPTQDMVVQAFREARQEILVLDQLSARGARPDANMRREVMAWHLDAIVDTVRSRGIRYRRYCQTDDPDQPFGPIEDGAAPGTDSPFAAHCLDMCDLKAQSKDVSLRAAPHVFPYKFVIVDKSVLILQLQELHDENAGTDTMRTICELVIHDPRQELIGHFLQMWRRIESHGGGRSLDNSTRSVQALRGRLGRPAVARA
jgi:hypothetical protein